MGKILKTFSMFALSLLVMIHRGATNKANPSASHNPAIAIRR